MFAKAYTLLKDSGLKFSNEKAPRLGAALAFYTALSIAPMLLVVIGVASAVYSRASAEGGQTVQRAFKDHLEDMMGKESADAVEAMLQANEQKPKGNLLSTLVGVVGLVFGATSVFAQLQDAINTIWQTDRGARPAQDDGGILATAWGMVKDRLLSLSVIAGMAFLLLVSTIFGAVVTSFSSRLDAVVPAGGTWLLLANLLVSVLLTATMFALIFKLLPRPKVSWSDVWIGAAVTAVLFNLGKFLLSFYFGTAAVGSSYGAAGSVVVLLLWVYYSTQILLFGACFTFVYASKFGSGVRTGSGEVIRDAAPAPGPKPA